MKLFLIFRNLIHLVHSEAIIKNSEYHPRIEENDEQRAAYFNHNYIGNE